MNWNYNNEEVTELPEIYGFIYKLTYLDDFFYIGKKAIKAHTVKPQRKDGSERPGHIRFLNKNVLVDPESGYVASSKAEKANLRKQGIKASRQPYEEVSTTSLWSTYEGSSEETKNHTLVKKEIIDIALHKQQLSFKEEKYLHQYNVLHDDKALNKSIAGRYHKHKV